MIKRIRNSPFARKVLKFGIVGGFTTLLSLGLFTLLNEAFNMYYPVAQVLSYLAGLIIGYFLNRNWTFSSHLAEDEKYFTRYLMVYLVSLGLSNAFLAMLVEYELITPPWVANIFATALSTLTNFIGTNYIVFKPAPKDDREKE